MAKSYMECRSSTLPPLTWTQFIAFYCREVCSNTLKDRKKDEFMVLKQGGMSVAANGAKFHTLSIYVM